MKLKNRELDLRPKPCRKCGASEFLIGAPTTASNRRFVHVNRKCGQCGEWLGGYTYKNKAKED